MSFRIELGNNLNSSKNYCRCVIFVGEGLVYAFGEALGNGESL